jgi:hypothetical protein
MISGKAYTRYCKFLVGPIAVLLSLIGVNIQPQTIASQSQATCQQTQSPPRFLVFGGGGSPRNNEVALENNLLYFQRTLSRLGVNPTSADFFFANGNSGQATIRYLDARRQERFKKPAIPYLDGEATVTNLRNWFSQAAQTGSDRPIFFYFTGHGFPNSWLEDNNAMLLWQNTPVSVQQFSTLLDQLPQSTPVVVVMAQCYSGSFANLIYRGGDPTQAIALQTRCGFFATIKSQPSVGCTPEVNEADYRDYSSSFFAGLSGYSRTGAKVTSADYNQDGKISYAEAHAFAKVDEQSIDLPVSTVEAWLLDQGSVQDERRILNQPMVELITIAAPQRQYVVKSLADRFQFDLQRSFLDNVEALQKLPSADEEVEMAYLNRLQRELMTIGMEKRVRDRGDQEAIAILDRLNVCESSSWMGL